MRYNLSALLRLHSYILLVLWPDNLFYKYEMFSPFSGCTAPNLSTMPLLNSRNFNISLETSGDTCSAHRLIRHKERRYISWLKHKLGDQKSPTRRDAQIPAYKREFVEKRNSKKKKIERQLASGSETDVYEFTSNTSSSVTESIDRRVIIFYSTMVHYLYF